MPIYYTLITRPAGPACSIVDQGYYKIFAVFLLIFLGFMPPILMMILSCATLILLRQQRRRIMPINQTRLRQRDNQLLKMLFVYVACHLICTIPFSITLPIVVYQLPTPSPTMILLFRLFVLLFSVSFSISFYIYTLCTPFYRHELCCLIKDMYNRFHRMIYRNHNQRRLQSTGNPPLKRS
jgi:hypothetical protein